MIKSRLYKVFNTAAILIFVSAFCFAQTPEAKEAEARVNQITEKAGEAFKLGLFSIQDNRRASAGEYFDKSVETFLMSSVNVNSNAKLQACYSQLIETSMKMSLNYKKSASLSEFLMR